MATARLSPDAAHRLLGRAAYGARPGEAEAVARMGLGAWLDAQLAPPAADAALEAALAAWRAPIRVIGPDGPAEEPRGLAALAMTQAERWAFLGEQTRTPQVAEIDRVRLELFAATMIRRAGAAAQLRERLVEFWHDHFIASTANRRIVVSLPEHDRRLRAHALGNFRALLEAVASSPAMLSYLNNDSSRAGAPNENYARELLELHTLGREAYFGGARSGRAVPRDAAGLPLGYVDADVWEAARAFTGWSLANAQRVDAGTQLPRTGEFTYVPAWHDPYQKRFLGADLDPFGPAMADGRAVLDRLATHPATARHLCRKLVRFLCGEPVPEAAVARGAEAFLHHAAAEDQIARVVRAILDGPEVTDAGLSRIRRHTDLALAAARAYGIPLAPNARLMGEMSIAGQPAFAWPTPDGQTMEADYYLSAGALRARWTLARALPANAWGNGPAEAVHAMAGQDAEAAVRDLARRVLAEQAPPVAATIARTWREAGRPERLGPAEAAELAGWVLMAPAFQAA